MQILVTILAVPSQGPNTSTRNWALKEVYPQPHPSQCPSSLEPWMHDRLHGCSSKPSLVGPNQGSFFQSPLTGRWILTARLILVKHLPPSPSSQFLTQGQWPHSCSGEGYAAPACTTGEELAALLQARCHFSTFSSPGM